MSTADAGIASLIQAQSHTFMEIDHELISTVILLPSADSRRVVVSYKQEYVHGVLVNEEAQHGWSELFLFTCNKVRFSCTEAHI